jgi:hypothetical protein
VNFAAFLQPGAVNALGISQTELATIASALTVYANRDVASYWGGQHAVRVSADGKDLQPGEIACALVDALPNAPGAIAYHDVAGGEVPVIFLALTQCNQVMVGSDSVSNALSHEIAETIGDPAVDLWVDDGSGGEWARELCDAVQEWGYTIDAVTVSDFVLPAFFAPGSVGPWNYLATAGGQGLTSALQTAPGGYQIKRTSGGTETQVHGTVAPHRCSKKRNWSSRTFRRGARV